MGNTLAYKEEATPSEARIPLDSGAKLQTLNCIVTIEHGGKQMTVIVDTGTPLFDPAASPSYRYIPCNTSTCDSLQEATGISNVCRADRPSCSYGLSYREGSYANGVLARDNMSLGSVGLWSHRARQVPTLLYLLNNTSIWWRLVLCLPTQEFDSLGSFILGNDYNVFKNLTPSVYIH
ncbi:aspartyl protease family protein At5g10770-like [Zingiber officinale]|uniref:aspartyl protease family protein At5g10770-like n=1 Tax=Zingiber officinale TaxID=94328 RepID=UPI001C4B6001|nr:aspartyl protease family protein At5g10770-like [Zingiber officinale]